MHTQNDTIFGFQWDEINEMQQKTYSRPVVKFTSDVEHAKQIMRDVEKFHTPVYWEIVEAYNLTLPPSYVRAEGDGYFRHQQPD